MGSLQMQGFHIKTGDFFRRIGIMRRKPPLYRFGKAAHQIRDQKIFRYFQLENVPVAGKQAEQILTEILDKQSVSIRLEDSFYIAVIGQMV